MVRRVVGLVRCGLRAALKGFYSRRYLAASQRGALRVRHQSLRVLFPLWRAETEEASYAPPSEPTTVEDLYKVALWCGARARSDRNLARRALATLQRLIEIAGALPELLATAGVACSELGEVGQAEAFYARAVADYESLPDWRADKYLREKLILTYCSWAAAVAESVGTSPADTETSVARLNKALTVLARAEGALGKEKRLDALRCTIQRHLRKILGKVGEFDTLFAEGLELLNAADTAWKRRDVDACRYQAGLALGRFQGALKNADCGRCRARALYNSSQAYRHEAREGDVAACLGWSHLAKRGYREVVKLGYEPEATWARDALRQMTLAWRSRELHSCLLLWRRLTRNTKET